MNTASADRLLRDLAKLLAPYVAEELERPRPTVARDYDDATCAIFVSGLGTPVVERALTLFRLLDERGKISSVELAAELGFDTPRAIAGSLTTPLKRRARGLELPLPFLGGEGSKAYGGLPEPAGTDEPGRTHWQDRDGIAQRMLGALRAEVQRRPEARMWRFVWQEGDVDILTPEQVAKMKLLPHDYPSEDAS
jgi:hypothetical protein